MILGLLKLIGRFGCAGYQIDFEISGKAYFITDDNLASRKARLPKFTLAPCYFFGGLER
jgi:hypothetical protein